MLEKKETATKVRDDQQRLTKSSENKKFYNGIFPKQEVAKKTHLKSQRETRGKKTHEDNVVDDDRETCQVTQVLHTLDS